MSESIEDGMGFSGLVPTAAEKKQDAYERKLWDRIRRTERVVVELEAERDRYKTALLEIVLAGYSGVSFIAREALEGLK